MTYLNLCLKVLSVDTVIIATGYVTLATVVTNIGSDLLSANLSHIDVWCSLLHFKQFGATAFRGSVSSCTIETKFFIVQYFSTFITVFAVLRSEDLSSGF